MTDPERNLVLTGFMGTGKSSVGRDVARMLGRPFLDMDEQIVERVGMSIPDLFRTQGEPAFRAQERALCEELATQVGLVVSTGGGTLVDPYHRQLLGRRGCLVCLDCALDELLRRLGGDQGRPMLWGEDPRQRLVRLWQERRPAYAQIPHHIDTSYRSPAQVAQEVRSLFASDPRVWDVATPTGSYQVQLVPGGTTHLGALLRIRDVGSRVAVVSDDNVWPLHGRILEAGLRASGYDPLVAIVPAGEQHKNLDTVRSLYDRFAEGGLDRSGAVLALGGGVVTDMTGLAAATFMRGVPLVPLPTTLLGMVDASVGGKVAVDHPCGKNLIGAFVQPLLVMLDPQLLITLPELERRAGLVEVIKAGVIGDADLFRVLEQRPLAAEDVATLRWMVERALAVKIAVVEEDPYEQGRRAVLNLGHTFGHALEVLSGYALHHGLAVSMGLVAAAHLAEIRGLLAAEERERITQALERHGLPTRHEEDPVAVYRAMGSDKKRRGGSLRFVLPLAIGQVEIVGDVPEHEVITAIERSHA